MVWTAYVGLPGYKGKSHRPIAWQQGSMAKQRSRTSWLPVPIRCSSTCVTIPAATTLSATTCTPDLPTSRFTSLRRFVVASAHRLSLRTKRVCTTPPRIPSAASWLTPMRALQSAIALTFPSRWSRPATAPVSRVASSSLLIAVCFQTAYWSLRLFRTSGSVACSVSPHRTSPQPMGPRNISPFRTRR